jgi:hypothetical protein
VQWIGQADGIDIMGRNTIAVSEIYEELKGEAKEAGLKISVEKK